MILEMGKTGTKKRMYVQSLSFAVYFCGRTFKNTIISLGEIGSRKHQRVCVFLFFPLFTWDIASASAADDSISSFWQHNSIFLNVITSGDNDKHSTH